jgi:hypothetical protein
MRVIMAVAYSSPAIASRRAKFDEDFRVPTLLGAQQLDVQYFFDVCFTFGSAVPEGRLAVSQYHKFSRSA